MNDALFNYFFEKYFISLSENEIQDVISIVLENKTSEETKKSDAEEILNYYNENRAKMPKAELLSPTRQSAIKKRLKEFGIEKVKEVILLASKSQFMNGYNPTGWTASFDWIIKSANFIKILEGNYKNKVYEFTTPGQQPKTTQPRRNR